MLHTGGGSGRSYQADNIYKQDFSFALEPENNPVNTLLYK